jgi:hypothetical protein
MAAQKDGGNGIQTRSKSFIVFKTDTILTNDNLINCWNSDRLNAALGRRPDPTSARMTVGIQGNMAVVQNMSGIIVTDVARGLGVVM